MKNIIDFKTAKNNNKRISVITCYDFWSARLIKNSNIDAVLVGDSLSMVMHGFENTISADIEMMAYHISAVRRGIGDKFVIGDMPFLAHRKGQTHLMNSVDTLLKAGANAVKIEGGEEQIDQIKFVIESGVPVMGHLGLTPQSINGLGGYKIQGKEEATAEKIIKDAKLLQEIGCFALVLELVPAKLSQKITDLLEIPTIGIGAGGATSGQVLVFHDMMGLNNGFNPKFLRKYLKGYELMLDALNEYDNDVKLNNFPNNSESF